jgi:GNAT superfamily N-acetyltransferase
MAKPFDIRIMEPGDVNFVLNSWMKSNRDSSTYRHVPSAKYFGEHERRIKRLQGDIVRQHLEGGLADIAVAYDPEKPGDIFGWACAQNDFNTPVLHYVYVKESYRQMGFAGDLLKSVGVEREDTSVRFTHWTHSTSAMERAKKLPNWVYDPYLFWSL